MYDIGSFVLPFANRKTEENFSYQTKLPFNAVASHRSHAVATTARNLTWMQCDQIRLFFESFSSRNSPDIYLLLG